MAPISSDTIDSIPGDAAGSSLLAPIGQPPNAGRPAVYDPEQARRFLAQIASPGTCFEIRLFKARFDRGFIKPDERYSSTLAGWYDSIDDAVADLGRLQGVSAFVTLNPIRDDLLARCHNRVAKQRSTSSDPDVASVRWVFVDIDPVRPAEVSATDGEHAAALQLREKILNENTEIQAASIWGSSGNGAWILIRVEDLDPGEGSKLVGAALEWFDRTYSTDTVKVDTSTRNPSRVMCVPGTIKAKGSGTAKRPWRTASIDSPERPLQPVALPGWVAAHPVPADATTGREKPSTSKPKPTPSPALRGADVSLRAAAYLDKMEPAVSGQGGHNQTFDAAAALVKGFGLSIEAAFRLLQQWNARCLPPWTDHELRHKLEDAEKRSGPVGYLLNARPFPGDASPVPSDGSRPAAGQPGDAGDIDDAAGREDDRHRLADLALEGFQQPDRSTIVYWRDEFWTWKNGHYSVTPEKELLAGVSGVVGREFTRIYEIHMTRYTEAVEAAAGEKKPPRRPRKLSVTRNVVADVLAVLREKTIEPIHSTPDQPAWIGTYHQWQPADIIPAANALVHLPSLATGLPCTMEPTPSYFCGYTVPYAFDPKAPEPVEWIKFLRSLWPDDPEAIECLQMWFGYLLTADTSLQKIWMLIGPPRSGKGTIIDVLRGLLGPFNVVAPTLSQLASQFGAAPMIGKPLAVITDCRLDGHVSKAAIVERLLSISGEDPQTIDRKYREPITVKLPTRIMIVSNEVPALRDSSGALASRFIIHECTRSFVGREDRGLRAKLAAELPGILLWAIEGWKMLHRQGGFEQHATPGNVVQQIKDQTSPVKRFLSEECVFDSGDDAWISKDGLHAAYLAWCNGASSLACDKIEFGRRLASAISADGRTLKESKKTNGDDGQRIRVYEGIRLRKPFEDEDGEPPF